MRIATVFEWCPYIKKSVNRLSITHQELYKLFRSKERELNRLVTRTIERCPYKVLKTWPKATCAQGNPEEPFRIWGQAYFAYTHILPTGFPGGSDGKESTCNVGELGSVPGLGRSPGEGKATHSSILENSVDCSPWSHKESDGTFTSTHLLLHFYIRARALYLKFWIKFIGRLFIINYILGEESCFKILFIRKGSCGYERSNYLWPLRLPLSDKKL